MGCVGDCEKGLSGNEDKGITDDRSTEKPENRRHETN
jgi:hypothetical protein